MLIDSTNVSSSKANDGGSPQEGTSEINLRFGARLRDLREERSLSQEELAVRLLVPVSHLADVEGGRKSASIIDLESLAQQFKISIAELLQGL
ncbi:helix-turn-helix domain-containing protein [Tunturiibacter gelidiferens]|uniref:helix-turn-helix domain-containing protein n=1 Tax=Tunturiibacter gelidiferens TaxID=3069689 RepID=UPI003D9B1633